MVLVWFGCVVGWLDDGVCFPFPSLSFSLLSFFVSSSFLPTRLTEPKNRPSNQSSLFPPLLPISFPISSSLSFPPSYPALPSSLSPFLLFPITKQVNNPTTTQVSKKKPKKDNLTPCFFPSFLPVLVPLPSFLRTPTSFPFPFPFPLYLQSKEKKTV